MRWGFVVLACALIISSLPTTAAAQAHLKAHLGGVQENPPVAGDGSGTASFTLIDNTIYYTLTVEGLSGPVTAAHLHRGQRGVNGPVVFDLGGDFNFHAPNTATGEIAGLTSADVADLLSGSLYLNVHTSANPGGEIRGQVDLASGAHLVADLDGNQENPPTGAAGTGTGAFILTEEALFYDVTVTGLTGGITASHFHSGALGLNGGVVRDIGGSFAGNRAVGVWNRGSSAPDLTPALVRDLLTGELYLNIHTAANPGGEIRGQLQLASGFGFRANFDGDQRVPPLDTDAEGTAALTLTPNGLTYDITVEGLTGPIIDAHFHLAAAGSNGPVVRGIMADFVGNTARGVWSPTDSQALTPQMICDLLEGNLYINVHTTANPGGEIRGQVLLNSATSFTARFSSEQENPPTGEAGTGTGTFRLTGAGLEYDISIDGLTGAITAAHIHDGTVGVNGGVVFNLGGSFTGNHAHGTWAAPSGAQIKELLAGNYYVNIHTGAHPGGELRGQVLLSSGCGVVFPLNSEQEEPPVMTPADGTGAATLTRDGLVVNFTVDNLSSAFLATHIHGAPTGTNGGVLYNMTGAYAGGHAEDVFAPADGLTPAAFDDVLLGNTYVNVHTGSFPSGELRGQLIFSEGFFADALLNGGAEVPPFGSLALGTGAFQLSDGFMAYDVSYDGLEGPFLASHFHQAPVGSNGPVRHDISGSFVAGTGRGIWREDDAQPLTTDDFCSFIRRDMYVNIHSNASPAGEIRGDLDEMTPASTPDAPAVPQFVVKATPNPALDRTTVSFQLERDGEVSASLFAPDGSLVRPVLQEARTAGRLDITVDLGGLPVGMYFLRVEQEGRSGVAKLLRIE